MLFTDIEGSTGLLQDLGDRYEAVRDEHAAVLHRVIRGGGGLEPVGRLVRHLRHVFRSGVAVSYCGRPVGR